MECDVLQEVSGYKCIPYADIGVEDRIEDVMEDGKLIVLIQTTPTQGHYICLFEDGKGMLNYFDPVGYTIEGIYNHLNDAFKYKQYGAQLIKSILNSRKYTHIFCNDAQFQQANTVTCGPHCMIRLDNAHITGRDYQNGLNPYRGDPDVYAGKVFDKVVGRKYKKSNWIH